MGRVSTAFRAFFGTLFNGATAVRVQQALGHSEPLSAEPAESPRLPKPPAARVIEKRVQSEALTLLATLQREARLVDFLKEEISGYSDQQVGAAVREIHRECANVLDRIFAIHPILKDCEGTKVNIAAEFDATRYRLTGRLTGHAPYQGTLRHQGWEATRCELPAFTGSESAAMTVAPAEVDIE